ncbi:MAG: (2Fe-2S)-binding protein [Pseudomonadota bacterium]
MKKHLTIICTLLLLVLMIICICNNINERKARQAIDAGATRPRDVLRRNGCDFNCGTCKCEMGEFIASEMDQRLENAALVAAE